MILNCFECGVSFEKEDREIRRWLNKTGRTEFYCSISCGATHENKSKKAQSVRKVCPFCESEFDSTTSKKAATYCSRSCASKGSVTDKRREGSRRGGLISSSNNLISPQQTLKLREAWKYEEIASRLNEMEIQHEYEFCFEDHPDKIFDLAIFDKKLLIEFDGEYHKSDKQIKRDGVKTELAESFGWQVHRVQTPDGIVFSSRLIDAFL